MKVINLKIIKMEITLNKILTSLPLLITLMVFGAVYLTIGMRHVFTGFFGFTKSLSKFIQTRWDNVPFKYKNLIEAMSLTMAGIYLVTGTILIIVGIKLPHINTNELHLNIEYLLALTLCGLIGSSLILATTCYIRCKNTVWFLRLIINITVMLFLALIVTLGLLA